MSLIILATFTFIISLLLILVIGDTLGRKSYCIWFNIVFYHHFFCLYLLYLISFTYLYCNIIYCIYYIFYCYLLFLIHYILSIIITKAALLASLYPGLPKQLYKIMMDLCNRLMTIHFYRIVFLHDFDKKNFQIVYFNFLYNEKRSCLTFDIAML